MRIFVKVKSRSREEKVLPPFFKLPLPGENEKDYYTIFVKEPPVEGKANDAVVRVLAEYFKVSRVNVRLVSGSASKTKVFEINEK